MRSTITRWSGRVLHSIQPREQEVPEVALECREVERAQLSLEPREGSSVVGRMIDQVGHDAPRRRPLQPGLGLAPPAPAFPEDGLLRLDARAIERVGLGKRQPQGPLVVSLQPGMADELAGEPHRAEPLIVEVIGQSVRGKGLQPAAARAARSGSQVANDDRGTGCPGSAADRRDGQAGRPARARSWPRGASVAGPSRIVRYWMVTACRSLSPP